ncbi:MAG TPA: signal peptidase I [Firmicutes bacterium]|uniref:signal peptidase I n=1 Tax=Gelria sp. Kuro-4 TaxID=2796927 RepID=UPI0019A68D3D|nr:signal peptidase I [Gelria sp. Kuro-4]HHV57772.1 signal peptidase I [Bacillota bacterium]
MHKVLWEYIQSILLAFALALFIITFVVQSFIVTGPSMEPTLHSGERLLINKFIYRFTQPKPGDIVVFHPAVRPRDDYIKRVIAVAGQTVEIRDGRVWVDGKPLAEPYLSEATYGQFGPVRIPQGRLFVLGDNRNNSQDSRYPEVGLVPLKSVIGKAALRYWPLGRLSLIGGAGR